MSSIRFPVSEAKQNDLLNRMVRLGLKEEDLEEQFIHGSGAGGQKINKTSVVVVIKHQPSGIVIRCMQTRSQSMNRFFARRTLVEKLEEQIFKEKSETQKKIEKIRRQKRKKSARAKQKMLDSKKHQGSKKKNRQKPADLD